ncbi:arsenic metallochaperone ArsD family protein [Macrococcus hajekii]|uniref:Arsenic metallochaperone ArsD family protein n=1 Tax=Macrococcus hajekii TaxID=198482 RepID=A0A4R6BLG8_9STAP|nr:arsenic metallochaperone ArsD family protein [Macrococcus hajekii]TDM02629.1 arsenic metallochaperone ArsD family protein [Macrococcus hajekii]GGB02607.1 hypothetical protein GCM10007190_08220 [Macrococcus hajekii]
MLVIYEDLSTVSDSDRFNIAMMINQLEQNHIEVTHYDIHEQPEAFNDPIKEIMQTEELPITVMNGEVIKTSAYLTQEEAGELIIVNQLHGIGKRCTTEGCH